MDKEHNVSDSMWWKEKERVEGMSFEDEVLKISKSVYTHIFGPINERKKGNWELEKIDCDLINDFNNGIGNAYHNVMHPYEDWGMNGKFDEFFIDFKNQLELICEKIKFYTNDEQYRNSEFVPQLADGMFKLNGEFYNLYNNLEKSEWLEMFSIGLRDTLQYKIDDNTWGYNYYSETEGKQIIEKYKQKMDQVKHLWIIVYRPLIQLVNRELDALLSNQDEEGFKAWLKRSYIWEHIKWVEQGKKFPRSYSILKDKQEKLLSQLQELEECFDEAGNLKDDAKIPSLDGIRKLEITKGDKRTYNGEQLKATVQKKLAKCLDWIKKPFLSERK